MARGRRRQLSPAPVLIACAACASAGQLAAPPGTPGPCPLPADALLSCHAPVLLQETGHAGGHAWDRPTDLDPDSSGRLGDDAAWAAARGPSSDSSAAWFARADTVDQHIYIFYGLYYPADWSGPPHAPHLDHAGDFEGALVVLRGATRQVEAVVTQAHGQFYLWVPADAGTPGGASGTVTVRAGRPVLFAESGGHGLYAWGRGPWRPRGGTAYPDGPAAVDSAMIQVLEYPVIRPLSRLRRFTRGPRGGFRDLPSGAEPPWRWEDRRDVGRGWLGGRGAIVRAPQRLYRGLRSGTPP